MVAPPRSLQRMAKEPRRLFWLVSGGGADVAHSLESVAEAADQVPPASRAGFLHALAWLAVTVPVAVALGLAVGTIAVVVWVAAMVAVAFWWSSQFGADRRRPS